MAIRGPRHRARRDARGRTVSPRHPDVRSRSRAGDARTSDRAVPVVETGDTGSRTASGISSRRATDRIDRRTTRSTEMQHSIRRDHRRGALRRFADGDAAGPQGLPRARGRPRDVPERHRVHARDAATRRRRARALGTPRSPHGDRLPADSHLHLRLRSRHDLGSAGHEGRSGGVLSPADRPGQTACRRRGRGRCGDPRRLHRRGGPDRRRTRRRHQRSFEGRRRRSPSVPRSSSARMAGTRSWPRPSGPNSTTRSRRCSPPITPTGAVFRWTGGSKPTSARTADSRRRRHTTA